MRERFLWRNLARLAEWFLFVCTVSEADFYINYQTFDNLKNSETNGKSKRGSYAGLPDKMMGNREKGVWQ